MSKKWFRKRKTASRRRDMRRLQIEALEARRVMAIDSDAVHFLKASGYFELVERLDSPVTEPV